MKVRTVTVDGALIVAVRGRIDGSNAGDFERTVRSVADCHEGPVILDYEHVDYMSSAGLRALLMIAKRLFGREAPFAVCTTSEPIADILRISGFDRVIDAFASLEHALAAVRG